MCMITDKNSFVLCACKLFEKCWIWYITNIFVDSSTVCNNWSSSPPGQVDTITVNDGAFLPLRNVAIYNLGENSTLDNVRVALSPVVCTAGKLLF